MSSATRTSLLHGTNCDNPNCGERVIVRGDDQEPHVVVNSRPGAAESMFRGERLVCCSPRCAARAMATFDTIEQVAVTDADIEAEADRES